MTREDMEQLIRDSVAATLKHNMPAMVKRMTRFIKETDNTDVRVGLMTANAISISSELSVQMTLDILEKLNIIDYASYDVLPEQPELDIQN